MSLRHATRVFRITRLPNGLGRVDCPSGLVYLFNANGSRRSGYGTLPAVVLAAVKAS